jgi:hypothetical protein
MYTRKTQSGCGRPTPSLLLLDIAPVKEETDLGPGQVGVGDHDDGRAGLSSDFRRPPVDHPL